LSAARSINYAERRWFRLLKIAQLLSSEEKPSLISEALRAARSIDEGDLRGSALSQLADQLPRDEQQRVLRDALNATRGTFEPSDTVSRIAQQLPVEEALTVARGIKDAGGRAMALAKIAHRLPVAEQPTVVVEALNAARSARAFWRADALIEVAPLLPMEQPSVLGEALSAAREIDDGAERAMALAQVTRQLSADEQPSVLDEALSAARGSGDWGPRESALRRIAPQLPVEEALTVAVAIDWSTARNEALTEIASRFGPAQMSDSLVNKWVETARVLAMHERSVCVSDFAVVMPIIEALGGESVVHTLGRSVATVGAWWP
jgi:hypothetical protein